MEKFKKNLLFGSASKIYRYVCYSNEVFAANNEVKKVKGEEEYY